MALALVIPGVLAVAWSTVTVAEYTSGVSAAQAYKPVLIRTFGTDTFALSEDFFNGNDLTMYKSTNNGATWTTVGTVLLFVPGSYDFEILSDGILVVCYTQSTDVFFTKSISPAGSIWTAPTTVEASANNLRDCDINWFTTTTLSIVYGDNTEADVSTRRTTDGGSTWGATVDIDTDDDPTTSVGARQTIEIARKNTTTAVVFWHSETGVGDRPLRRSITTDAGATWGAPAQVSTLADVVNGIDATYVEADRYDVVAYTGTDVVWAISTDGTASWSSPVTVDTFAGVSGPSIVVDPTDTDKVGIAWDTQGVNTATPRRYSQTTDLGGTWSADESIVTLPTAVTHPVDRVGMELAVLPNGNVAAGHLHCSSAVDFTNAGDCENANIKGVRILVSNGPFSVTAGGASASFSATNLVGADVDTAGSLAVIRSDDGGLDSTVSVYAAQSLTLVGGPVATNCAEGTNPYEDGVMAKNIRTGNGEELVGFLNCDGSGDAQYFSIRQRDGSTPTDEQFSGCEPCDFDIALSEFDEPADSGLGQLGQVQDYPIDYSRTDQEGFFDFRRLAWSFSTQQCDSPPGPDYCDGTESGRVGVATWTETEQTGVTFANMDSTAHLGAVLDVEDFCLGLDGSNYYLASVDNDASAHTYSVTFVDPHITPVINVPGASFGAGHRAVACGGGNVMLADGATVTLLTRTLVQLDSVPGTALEVRGVALSEEFVSRAGPTTGTGARGTSCTTATEGTGNCIQFGVYVDLGEVVILNVTGGQMVETDRFPHDRDGSFHSIFMDRTAQNVWVFSSTGGSRFLVTNSTTILPVSVLPGEETGGTPPTDDPEGQISAEEIEAFLESEVFWGIIITLVLAMFGFYLAPKGSKGTGAMLGAALGFSVSSFLGWFHPAIFLGVVLLAGVVVYRRYVA